MDRFARAPGTGWVEMSVQDKRSTNGARVSFGGFFSVVSFYLGTRKHSDWISFSYCHFLTLSITFSLFFPLFFPQPAESERLSFGFCRNTDKESKRKS